MLDREVVEGPAVAQTHDVGTRNDRGRSGCFARSTITPSDTSTKANRVPMFESSANVSISQIPAGIPTTKPAIQVLI